MMQKFKLILRTSGFCDIKILRRSKFLKIISSENSVLSTFLNILQQRPTSMTWNNETVINISTLFRLRLAITVKRHTAKTKNPLATYSCVVCASWTSPLHETKKQTIPGFELLQETTEGKAVLFSLAVHRLWEGFALEMVTCVERFQRKLLRGTVSFDVGNRKTEPSPFHYDFLQQKQSWRPGGHLLCTSLTVISTLNGNFNIFLLRNIFIWTNLPIWSHSFCPPPPPLNGTSISPYNTF